MIDWSDPPGVVPEPAEVICDLDLIDVTMGRGGPSVRGRVRERVLDGMARDLEARGTPYVRDGVRHPARSS